MTARDSSPSQSPSHLTIDSQPLSMMDDDADSPVAAATLAENVDVLVCRADWLYYLGAYQVISLLPVNVDPIDNRCGKLPIAD